MIRRISVILVALMLALSLAACGAASSSDVPSSSPDGASDGASVGTAAFRATVLEEDESSITVEPDADSDAYKSADKIVVSLGDALITEADGTALEIYALGAGDVVEITYDGTIAESYPAQINSCTVLVRISAVEADDTDEADETEADMTGDAFNIQAGDMPDPDSYASPFSQPDFTEAAGFAVSNIPDLGADSTYDMDYFIEGGTAELKFTIEGNFPMFLRIAVDKGQGDISGVHGDFEEDVTDEIDGITLRTRASAAGPAVKNWSKNGYLFSIYFPHNTMSMAGGVTQRFIDELTLIPETAPAQ